MKDNLFNELFLEISGNQEVWNGLEYWTKLVSHTRCAQDKHYSKRPAFEMQLLQVMLYKEIIEAPSVYTSHFAYLSHRCSEWLSL